jgi:mannose-1-phosphate guanylyltransferase
MQAIILAGGGGSRLWPVSRKSAPKQVTPIIGDMTLLRATWSRVRKGFAAKDIVVATAESQKDMVRRELPELPKENLIVEPCRRDTAAAIGYALLHLARRDPEATFVTVNSDAYVRDAAEYHRVLRAAAAAVGARPDHAVLVGITPTYPETGYGYIKMGAPQLEVTEDGRRYDALEVGRFVEKPDLKTAERYLEGGYLWNPTLVVGRVSSFLKFYDEHLPAHAAIFAKMAPILATSSRATERKKLFAKLPSVSIDYGILEKEKKLLVVPAGFGWADVGHWRAVRDILAADPDADVVKGTHVGVDSGGNLIYGFSGKLVATVGMKDMIIIETADAVLVCPKERAQDVKKIVGQLEGDRALQKYL